jgi:hypothetical protein
MARDAVRPDPRHAHRLRLLNCAHRRIDPGPRAAPPRRVGAARPRARRPDPRGARPGHGDPLRLRARPHLPRAARDPHAAGRRAGRLSEPVAPGRRARRGAGRRRRRPRPRGDRRRAAAVSPRRGLRDGDHRRGLHAHRGAQRELATHAGRLLATQQQRGAALHVLSVVGGPVRARRAVRRHALALRALRVRRDPPHGHRGALPGRHHPRRRRDHLRLRSPPAGRSTARWASWP